MIQHRHTDRCILHDYGTILPYGRESDISGAQRNIISIAGDLSATIARRSWMPTQTLSPHLATS